MVRRIEEHGWKVADAASAAGLSVRRRHHWLGRYQAGGERMLCDRSSTPARYLRPGRAAPYRTRPYTPRTNGKAERFIQTSLRERAYARAYLSSAERTHAMHPWIADCNHRRPHSALGAHPPALRLNNVLGFDN